MRHMSLMFDCACNNVNVSGLVVGVFASCVLVLVLLTFTIHGYVFVNDSSWQLALRDYLV